MFVSDLLIDKGLREVEMSPHLSYVVLKVPSNLFSAHR